MVPVRTYESCLPYSNGSSVPEQCEQCEQCEQFSFEWVGGSAAYQQFHSKGSEDL
jgi:hypothetical protein